MAELDTTEAPKNIIKALHSAYKSHTRSHKKEPFELAVWKPRIASHLEAIVGAESCRDLYLRKPRKCTCMRSIGAEDKEIICDYLLNFALLEQKDQWLLVLEWMKYAEAMASKLSRRETKGLIYLVPGTANSCCFHAVAAAIGYTKEGWSTVRKFFENGETPRHRLCERVSNNALDETELSLPLAEFFINMRNLAAPRATKLVRNFTTEGDVQVELRDEDAELIELPTCHTKRSLHRRYLWEVGWQLELDSKSRVVQRYPRDGFTLETCGHPVSWPTFLSFWETHFKEVVIQKPSLDVCDDCFVFANQHKYKPPDSNDGEASLSNKEDVVLRAAKHVRMARKQRELFIEKKRVALEDANKPQEGRVHCFVADFAQNMYVPNFNSEQPGATYYYSPMNVYPFGIVDGSCDPSMLTAHVYYEGKDASCCCLLIR